MIGDKSDSSIHVTERKHLGLRFRFTGSSKMMLSLAFCESFRSCIDRVQLRCIKGYCNKRQCYLQNSILSASCNPVGCFWLFYRYRISLIFVICVVPLCTLFVMYTVIGIKLWRHLPSGINQPENLRFQRQVNGFCCLQPLNNA